MTRQWHRNPDSVTRKRRYRLRDRAELGKAALPELRIVDDVGWTAVQA